MAASVLKQTTLRVDAEVLRKARFVLDCKHKSVNDYLVEQLEALVRDWYDGPPAQDHAPLATATP
jgi:hypothetical protein